MAVFHSGLFGICRRESPEEMTVCGKCKRRVAMSSLVPRLHSPALSQCDKNGWGVESGNEASYMYNLHKALYLYGSTGFITDT